MKTQDEWTDDIMSSLDGMSRATIPAALHQKIMDRLATLPKRQIMLVPRRAVWLMAAGLLLLIGTNLYVLTTAGSNRGNDRLVRTVGDNPIGAEYFAPTPSI